jgi:type IV secretory pathway TraG/TraD family ATPase VirD4
LAGDNLWIAVQSLSQLDAVYGKTRAKILRDNMETQIYYRPANQETADYLEHSLGRRSQYARSETEREGMKVSQGLSEQAVPLLTAQEIKRMRDEDIIGFHRRLYPFQAKRMDWRRFGLLTQRQRIPAPELTALSQPADHEWKNPSSGYIDPDSIGDDSDTNNE